MRIAAAASWLHKWLALIVSVQILFWVASGLFFAVYPIERVRSEHRIAAVQAPLLEPAALLSPQDLAPMLTEPPSRITYERGVRGEAVAVVEFAARAPMLIDLEQRRVISPINEARARAIASTYIADAPAIRSVTLVTEASPEYRAALPAWRVVFEDVEALAVYVAADTGRVTARRSDLWRVYDALWALHIMDWRDHENFNNGLLIVASFASLIVVLAGFVLFPYRLRFMRR